MEKFINIEWSENKNKTINDFSTSFSVKPLERGMATTIGNSIRRILLSSIPSVAAFAVRIKGIEHEFVSIPNLDLDVLMLNSNLKQIKFVYNPSVIEDNKIYKIYLKSNEEAGEILAKDLILPLGIEIVNPELVIANATKAGALELELYIRSGRSFVEFEDNKKFIEEKHAKAELDTKLTSGQFIALDSDFSPIKKVNYNVKELNTSSLNVQEELILDIETNGTISAKEAIAFAAKILIAHFNVIGNVDNLDKNEIFAEVVLEKENSKIINLKIKDLDLSVRSLNALEKANYETVSQLQSLTIDDLKNIKNLGEKSMNEIIEKLEKHNIFLSKGEEYNG